MSVNKIVYTKVSPSDPPIVQLAEQLGEKPEAVAAMVNQQRYRAAYNKVKMERDKAMRQWFKEHPEALKEVKL